MVKEPTPVAPPSAAEHENALLRQTFCDNESLLKSMRALFFGLPLGEDEKGGIIATFQNAELLRVVRKRFLPRLDRDAPIGQTQDIWLGTEQNVLGSNADTVRQTISYKRDAIELMEIALALLTDSSKPPMDLTFDRLCTDAAQAKDPLGIALLTRNQFIKAVESNLVQIMLVANKKVETPQAKDAKAKKDSAE